MPKSSLGLGLALLQKYGYGAPANTTSGAVLFQGAQCGRQCFWVREHIQCGPQRVGNRSLCLASLDPLLCEATSKHEAYLRLYIVAQCFLFLQQPCVHARLPWSLLTLGVFFSSSLCLTVTVSGWSSRRLMCSYELQLCFSNKRWEEAQLFLSKRTYEYIMIYFYNRCTIAKFKTDT